MKTDAKKLAKVTELLESAITDFEKLEPFLEGTATALAKIYRDDLAAALRDDEPPAHPPMIGEICMCPDRTGRVLVNDPAHGSYYACTSCRLPF